MKKEEKETIRIVDIAKMAGVSIGTVDRVLHNRPNISTKSRQKVEAVLKEIQYRPNRNASALARNKPLEIYAFIPQHTIGTYWEDVIKGMYHASTQYADFKVHTTISYYDPYNLYAFEISAQKLLDAHPDGVVMAPTEPKYSKKFIDQLNKAGIPHLFIDSEIPNYQPLSFVGQNAQKSGFFAARMLMLLNPTHQPLLVFRKIYAGVTGSNQQDRRQQGFEAYMTNQHPDVTIHYLDLPAKQPDEDELMLDHFFAAHPSSKVGIIFNSNAFIIGNYLKKKQISDFHLFGYDLIKQNTDLIQTGYIDFLIAQSPKKQGHLSIQTLCDYILFGTKPAPYNYISIQLVTNEILDDFIESEIKYE